MRNLLQRLSVAWLITKSLLLTVLVLALAGPVVVGIVWLAPLVLFALAGVGLFILFCILLSSSEKEGEDTD